MKHWYQSKTIWGGVAAIIAAILAVMGVDVSAADQVAIEQAGIAIVGGFGGLVAVYGRIKAQGKITK